MRNVVSSAEIRVGVLERPLIKKKSASQRRIRSKRGFKLYPEAGPREDLQTHQGWSLENGLIAQRTEFVFKMFSSYW